MNIRLPPLPLGFFLGRRRKKILKKGVVEGLLRTADKGQHVLSARLDVWNSICLQSCSILGDDVVVPQDFSFAKRGPLLREE